MAAELEFDIVVLAPFAVGRVKLPEDAADIGALELHGDLELAKLVLHNLAFTS